jgi:hypothetical protein
VRAARETAGPFSFSQVPSLWPDQLANAILTGEHIALAALPLWYWRRHRAGVVLRRLAPALAVFFLTGAVSHAMLAFDGGIPPWWPAARAIIVAAFVAPYCWWGLRSLAGLPTKEEHAAALADLRETVADRDTLIRTLTERNKNLNAAANDMREHIEHLRWRQVNDDEYNRLREHLHAIRNT